MNSSIISFICLDESRINCFLSSYNIPYNQKNILYIEINNNETRFILDNSIFQRNKGKSNINKVYKFYIFSYTHSITSILNSITSIGNDNIDYFFSSDNISSITKIKEISQNKKIIILPCSHPTRSTKSPCDGSMLYTAFYKKGEKKIMIILNGNII